jgi:ribosome-associated protein
MIARIADEFRCTDVVLLDLTGVTPVVDYFVIATGTSRRQMHAVAIEVERILKAAGSRRIGIEGFETSTWILEDYGDVVLHLFTDEARSVYNLESLWADAAKLDWKSHVDSTASAG